ncbi:MAG: DUF2304 domain-containing protein [Candidatus Dormibacteria bacterium]
MSAILFALSLSIGFLYIVVRAIRAGRLGPRMSLAWLGAGGAMLVTSATLPLNLLSKVAHAIGIVYPPDFLLVAAVFFLAVVLFQLSVAVAQLSARQTSLAQELGLLQVTLRQSPAIEATAPAEPSDPDPQARADGLAYWPP